MIKDEAGQEVATPGILIYFNAQFQSSTKIIEVHLSGCSQFPVQLWTPKMQQQVILSSRYFFFSSDFFIIYYR